MSRASNSLLVSDVTTTPIKLKYSSSYSNTAICDSGIYAQSGLNGPVTVTGSVPQRTLRYLSIRHLFYSNFLTGSYAYTTSSADNSLQSTAASGTFENNSTLSSSADIRYFPTESLSKIKIINIPKNTFGEKISRKSFFLTGSNYYLTDDGNGNLIDEYNSNRRVGNIIYPQGFAIITNPDYYCVMDGGPLTFPKNYTFDIVDNPKTFNPILDAQADCAPIDTTTLTLITASGFLFPSSSQNSAGLVTLSETDTLTNRVGLYRDFYTVKSTYCASSDKQPITVNIVDCTVTGLTAATLSCGINGLSLTSISAPTPTPSMTPGCTPTSTPRPTQTPEPTPTPSPTPSPTVTPGPTPTATIPPATPGPTPTATIPPATPGPTPVSSKFNVRLCSGTTTYVMSSNGLNPVVGKVYTMQDLNSSIPGMNGANCWEVLATTTNAPNSTNVSINTEYVDCGRCTAVSFTAYTGSSLNNACNGTITTQIYYRGTLGVGTILYEDLGLTAPITPVKYVNDTANSQVYLVGVESPENGYVTAIVYCPTPTPSPTTTPAPVSVGGSFTVYYGSSEGGACAATANTTIYYKTGDPASLNNGQYYYTSDGFPYNGTFIEFFTQGVSAYGSIGSNGLFTQTGNCP